jgi:hypothetical protein
VLVFPRWPQNDPRRDIALASEIDISGGDVFVRDTGMSAAIRLRVHRAMCSL